jgi:hypothetical protein
LAGVGTHSPLPDRGSVVVIDPSGICQTSVPLISHTLGIPRRRFSFCASRTARLAMASNFASHSFMVPP